MTSRSTTRRLAKHRMTPVAGALALTLFAGLTASASASFNPVTDVVRVLPAVAGAATGDTEQGAALYTIVFKEPALASYAGTIAGLPRPERLQRGATTGKINLESASAQAYLRYLEGRQQVQVTAIENLLGRPLDVTARMQHALNAVIVVLDASEAAAVGQRADVDFVERDHPLELHTDNGPIFIGAPAIWNGDTSSGVATRGEGIVVGIIDTGINWESPAYAAISPIDGYVHQNPRGTGNYLGLCQAGFADVGRCNDKLIGIYNFAETGATRSGVDTQGHGSHTSSTVAGNRWQATFASGQFTISGVAPRANIISYLACPTNSCPSNATSQSVNQAVIDGVDVINFSIGGGTSPWTDATSTGFRNANAAGIFVAASSGNTSTSITDPQGQTNHLEPWVETVAASTQNRIIAVGLSLDGSGAPANTQNIPMRPGAPPLPTSNLVNVPIIKSPTFVNATNNDGCSAYPANTFTRAVTPVTPPADRIFADGFEVVSDRIGAVAVLSLKSAVASPCASGARRTAAVNAGAVGVVFVDDTYLNLGAANTSWAMLTTDWTQLEAGMNPATATVTIDIAARAFPSQGDVIAGFSLRGPRLVGGQGIVKPDITGPGVDILAVGAANVVGANGVYLNNGTSMSSPHLAGSAALLAALQPTWTPPQIKSAMNLTSNNFGAINADGTPVRPWDYGSGRVNLATAAKVGLVLDETPANFLAANPSSGGDISSLNLASIAKYAMTGTQTFTRTFQRVRTGPQTYTLGFSGLPAGAATFSPSTFTIASGATQAVTVSIDSSLITGGVWSFGELTLTPAAGDEPNLHLPVAVHRVLAPSVTKAFAPSSVGIDTPSTLTITLANPTATNATLSSALTDTFPSGLVVAPTPSAGTTCTSGTVTAAAGAGSVSLGNGAQIPANGSCTVTVNVVASVAGSYTNTIPAGALVTSAGTSTSPATAVLTVTGAPVCSAQQIVDPGFEATDPGTVTNPNWTVTSTTFGTSLCSAAECGAAYQRSGDWFVWFGGLSAAGTETATASQSVVIQPGFDRTLKFWMRRLAATNTTVQMMVSIDGNVLQTYPRVTTTEAAYLPYSVAIPSSYSDGNPHVIEFRYTKTTTATSSGSFLLDDVTLDCTTGGPPTISQAFGASLVPVNTPTALTITLANGNATASMLTAPLVDTLPAGLVVANPANATTTCPNGTLTAAAGSGSITLSSGAQIPSGSCTVKVDVLSASEGAYVNSLAAGSLQTTQGANDYPSTATLNVGEAIYRSGPINHTVAATSNGTSINWTTRGIVDTDPATGYDFNVYGASLTAYWTNAPAINAGVAPTTSSSNYTVLAPGAVIGPSSVFSRANGAMTAWRAGVDGYLGFRFNCSSIGISPNGTCYGYMHMTTTATTGNPAVIVDYAFDRTGAAITIPTGPILVAPTVTKAFAPATVTTGSPSTLTITLANTNATAATLSAALTDNLPNGLVVASTPAAATTCTSGTVTAAAGTGSVSLASGAQIPANGNCTVTVNVSAALPGSYANVIPGGALQTDAGNNPAPANATLTVNPPPNLLFSNRTTDAEGSLLNGTPTLTSGTRYTPMVCNKLTLSQPGEQLITNFSVTLVNQNAASVTPTTTVRFFDDSGAGGAPGIRLLNRSEVYIGGGGYNSALAPGKFRLNAAPFGYTATRVPAPAGGGNAKVWACVYFTSTSLGDTDLANLGVEKFVNAPTAGSTEDVAFVTTGGAAWGNDPTGSLVTGAGNVFGWELTTLGTHVLVDSLQVVTSAGVLGTSGLILNPVTGVERNAAGYAATIAAPTASWSVTGLVAHPICPATTSYTNVQAVVQFWNTFNGSTASPVFGNTTPISTRTFDLGPVTCTVNSFLQLPIRLTDPVLLGSGTQLGVTVKYVVDGSEGVFTNLLNNAPAAAPLIAVGSNASSGGTGWYKSATNRPDLNFESTDYVAGTRQHAVVRVYANQVP